MRQHLILCLENRLKLIANSRRYRIDIKNKYSKVSEAIDNYKDYKRRLTNSPNMREDKMLHIASRIKVLDAFLGIK